MSDDSPMRDFLDVAVKMAACGYEGPFLLEVSQNGCARLERDALCRRNWLLSGGMGRGQPNNVCLSASEAHMLRLVGRLPAGELKPGQRYLKLEDPVDGYLTVSLQIAE